MKVVLFLIDAFRYDYISKESTPFLWKCAHEGKYIEQIIPSAGFCERTEIFMGQQPIDSGFFTAIGFDPINSPYNNKKILLFLGRIENFILSFSYKYLHQLNNKFSRYLRNIFEIIYFKFSKSNKRLKFYKIPFSFLQFFNLTEDEQEFNEYKEDGIESIFTKISKKGKKTFYNSFTSLGFLSNDTDYDRIMKAILANKNDDYYFTPIYISLMDSLGHLHGPDLEKLQSELIQLDKLLEKSVLRFLKENEDISFIFLGDHGMSAVNQIIDIYQFIIELGNENKLKPGKDFVFFLDSTLFRIWYLTEKAKKLDTILKNNEFLLKNGVMINNIVAKQYSLPLNDRRYGDFAWWANDGVLIFPDFFHNKKPYKGMHGYQPDKPSTYGSCIVWGKHIGHSYTKKKNLSDVYHIINNLLDN